MGSLNKSHHEQTGGVCVFAGELILLYCDSVNCEVDSHGSVKGRMYLTTHRIIFTATPINQSLQLKSFSAPFYAMFDLNLEQPIFGANYIRGKVRGEIDSPNFAFKLKFYKGGAIEFGQAMSNAAKLAAQQASQQQFQPPPPYTPTASAYYQAPDSVFQPTYPVGFVLPTQIFTDVPPSGHIYMSDAPPPYPGFVAAPNPQFYANGATPNAAYPPPPTASYPPPPNSGYPPPFNAGYPRGPTVGFAPHVMSEKPPSYDEATKKTQ